MWKFDTTCFDMGGLPSYLFFAGTGLMVALAIYPFLLLVRNCRVDIFMPRLFVAIPAIFVGAKLLGIVVNILNSIQFDSPIDKNTFFQSGIVYYGGLLGIISCFYITSKYRNNYDNQIAKDAFAVLIPLFHVFGRIGCFTSGCCYGIESKLLITVVYSINTGNGIATKERVPVQLIEAVTELIIFSILLFLYLRKKCNGKLIDVYLIYYAIIRFGLEFIRGDNIRGKFFYLSTSQWISCFLGIYIIVKIIFGRKGKQKNEKVFK